jgi:N-acetylmuramoyl-L-alanine amidase
MRMILESKGAAWRGHRVGWSQGALTWILILVSLCQPLFALKADALFRHASQTRHHHETSTAQTSSSRHHGHRRVHGVVTQYSGSNHKLVYVGRGRHRHLVAARSERHHPKPERHAYPVDFFMAKAPPFDTTPLSAEVSADVRSDFYRGTADSYSPRTLVKAGVVTYHPIRGGIFWRREPIKYVIVHSTEPGVIQSALRIIESWSSMGRRHPGAQYVVDRDGSIMQALDPDLGTVHVNIFKTLPGINNDDSVGIEMCHTGKQDYPPSQVDSVTKLVVYLQNRYHVPDANVITHRYAQQGDHTDPVNFDWEGFLANKNLFKNQALAFHFRDISREALTWLPPDLTPPPDNFLQLHRQLGAVKDDQTLIELKVPVEAVMPPPVAAPPPIPARPTAPPPRPELDRLPIVLPPARTNPSTPPLRGPIEMAPGEASILNRANEAPTPGLNNPFNQMK